MEYGCIGEKLGHSFSKIIHNKLYDYNYELREISRDGLADFLKEKDFKAINVTIPYKQDVIPFLSEISDIAKRIGAVNTIVNKNGKLYGYNTDFSGMNALIEYNGIKLKDKKVLILGSGGTSKTAFAVAESMGAKGIYRVSRKGGDGLLNYKEAEEKHNDAEIIINTTPCGMFPNIGESAISLENFSNLKGVIDAVYNPLDSKLIVDVKRRGIKAAGGLYMLIAQAVFAAEKFIDTKIDKAKIDIIYNEILKDKENIVLIGMPSCGKTTVGKELSKILNKEFIDTDILIEERYGKISDIFEEKGEAFFRGLESEVIKEVSAKQSAIIATGGGAVLNPENINFLKGNGKIIFIDRPLDKLITTSDRPLSSNRELLEKRYNERYDIYCKSADFIVKSDGNIEECISKILEVMNYENTSN